MLLIIAPLSSRHLRAIGAMVPQADSPKFHLSTSPKRPRFGGASPLPQPAKLNSSCSSTDSADLPATSKASSFSATPSPPPRDALAKEDPSTTSRRTGMAGSEQIEALGCSAYMDRSP